MATAPSKDPSVGWKLVDVVRQLRAAGLDWHDVQDVLSVMVERAIKNCRQSEDLEKQRG